MNIGSDIDPIVGGSYHNNSPPDTSAITDSVGTITLSPSADLPTTTTTISKNNNGEEDRLYLSPSKSKSMDDSMDDDTPLKKNKRKKRQSTSKTKDRIYGKSRSQSPSPSQMKRSSPSKTSASRSSHERKSSTKKAVPSPRPPSPPPLESPPQPQPPASTTSQSSISGRTPPVRSQSSPVSSANKKSTMSMRQRMHMSSNMPGSLPLMDSPVTKRLHKSQPAMDGDGLDHNLHDNSISSHRFRSSTSSSTSADTPTASLLEQLPSHSNSSSSTRRRGSSNNNNSVSNASSTSSLKSNRSAKSSAANSGHLSSSSIGSFAIGGQQNESSLGSMSFLGASANTNANSSTSLAYPPHHATATKTNVKSVIPPLYRCARKGYWDEVASGLEEEVSTDELAFQYKKDGTTILHLAVMSRTGYIDSFRSRAGGVRRSKSGDGSSSTFGSSAPVTAETPGSEAVQRVTDEDESNMASLSVIEDLLRISPQLAEIKCTLNGYTPLTYACLVCNATYNTEDCAAMARLFLKYSPSSINVFSREGLSPVDVHIVSYSHHHKNKEDASARGRTSTSVLRTLLQHSPELANLRSNGDRVEGPIELLYKCNATAFSQAVMDEVYESDDDGTVRSDYTIPERRQRVVDTVTKWWIWSWAVMILKYGSLTKNKKKGSRFAAVHTASMQVGVPTPILSITIYAFPRQIKLPIETADEAGNLPLHAVCSWPCHMGVQKTAPNDVDPMVPIRKALAISRVLDEFPFAVKFSNKRGETALELALTSRTSWDGGVRRLVKANPKALKVQSPISSLYPFMIAATAVAITDEGEDDKLPTKRQDLQCLRTIYGLLRANPKVLALSLSSD
mmetsp:Transcript_8906/g.22471  ORF Transcript_8906/g.22471 Transcript_8906/m.22471 type:complete len:847 (+) Transcript_8906:177-2717(+)